jgi:hypothetical protein
MMIALPTVGIVEKKAKKAWDWLFHNLHNPFF